MLRRVSVLLRARHRQEAERQAKQMKKIALEVGMHVPIRTVGARPGGDVIALRGLPAIGCGGGAIRGTRPGDSLRWT